jgi:hypothetical protein
MINISQSTCTLNQRSTDYHLHLTTLYKSPSLMDNAPQSSCKQPSTDLSSINNINAHYLYNLQHQQTTLNQLPDLEYTNL